MATQDPEEIREAVRERYSKLAEKNLSATVPAPQQPAEETSC